MRRKIVAGNWKMHGSKLLVRELLNSLKTSTQNLATDVIVFPPFVYIPQAQTELQTSHIQWGAQNLAIAEEGAFTGEVSAPMLREFGCRYVLVGHSERRQYYHETNDEIAQKFLLAVQHELMPILCLGETLKDREGGHTFNVIQNQINAILALENWRDLMQNAILAYEPVWAIGTGKTASPEQAQEVHRFIRATIAERDAKVALHLPILYGGSVKPSNASALFTMIDIDGALVGGASLQAKDFTEICQCNL